MESKANQDARQSRQRGRQALITLGGMAILGLVLILVFSRQATSALSVFSIAAMYASVSVLAGGLFGFLFGIPRTLQQQREEHGPVQKSDGPQEPASTYAPNTNLEQISDWLTKILVGAGLIQVTKLRQALGELGTNLAPGFGGGEAGRVFALATVLSYLLLGFLIGYLWTRLYFAGALRAADVESLAQEIKQIRQQSDLDARAISLALRQLNPSPDVPVPTQEELDSAFADASSTVRAQIFYQAQVMRAENWEDPATKAKMERTIPIFQALIHTDKDKQYHRNYGQLGYALKDSRTPKWQEAEDALTQAVHIRGQRQESGWAYYEFNRAICRIMRDDPTQSRPSPPDVRKKIVEDLQFVFADEKRKKLLDREPAIGRWRTLNNVTDEELAQGTLAHAKAKA